MPNTAQILNDAELNIRMKIYAHFQERTIFITFSIVIQKKSDVQPIMMRLIKKQGCTYCQETKQLIESDSEMNHM